LGDGGERGGGIGGFNCGGAGKGILEVVDEGIFAVVEKIAT